MIPMIETQEGIDNIDEILSVPGISGIYIGPSDMGLSLGLIPTLDREEPQILGIYEKLLASCKRHGKFAGLHNGTAAYAARMIGMGFRFVTIANDSGLMARAAREAVAATRKAAGDDRELSVRSVAAAGITARGFPGVTDMAPPLVIRLHLDDGVVIARAALHVFGALYGILLVHRLTEEEPPTRDLSCFDTQVPRLALRVKPPRRTRAAWTAREAWIEYEASSEFAKKVPRSQAEDRATARLHILRHIGAVSCGE